MSQETSAGTDRSLLRQYMEEALASHPLKYWGHFYPCLIATWRYIEATRPGYLGTLDAGYDGEPYFSGRGAEWFCDELIADERYLDLVEAIMYPLTKQLPREAIDRGFIQRSELPPIDENLVLAIETLITAAVDDAKSLAKL